MKIELSQPFAANGKVDEFDVKQMKKALNRLGYYEPYETVGITGIADAGVFDALKTFQKDHGLSATGVAKPDDETVHALNKEASKTPEGQYIWRTVEDDKVRKGHAEFNRTVRSWSDDPDPGEEFNCRCWAESLPLNNCKEEKEKYIEAQKRVKDLTERFHDLLLQLNELREKNNALIKDAQKSLGVRVVAYILTLPFDRLGFLGDLLQRYFDNIISNELIEAAENFMEQVWAIKQKIQYTRDQRDIVLSQLERTAKELEDAKKRLEECEKNKK